MFKSTPVNGIAIFIGNWELFQPRSRGYFYAFPLFASFFQRSHSSFQFILSPLLVSSSMGYDIFHRLNTNHVYAGILATPVNVYFWMSKNVVRSLHHRIAITDNPFLFTVTSTMIFLFFSFCYFLSLSFSLSLLSFAYLSLEETPIHSRYPLSGSCTGWSKG